MGEHSDEDHPGRTVRIAPESFSDIIFGLALSIGSLILIQSQVHAWQDIFWNVLLFGFSFLIIAITWLLYSHTISLLSVEASSTLTLNMVLLFLVALEPYLFYLLMNQATQGLLEYTSIDYALDVGTMYLILAALTWIVLKRSRGNEVDRRMLQPKSLNSLRRTFAGEIAVGALFLFSTAPFFWVSTSVGHLRFVLWYCCFLIFIPIRISTSRIFKKK
jgi:uncharacterized membrane protein